MWCAAKKVDWHLCLLKSITWTTKHGQIQNTPLQSAAVLFFNPMCSAPLMPVWCNKTTRIFFDSIVKKFGQGWDMEIYIGCRGLVSFYQKTVGFFGLMFLNLKIN